MDALFESIEGRKRPVSSYVACAASGWIKKFAPFSIRKVTLTDHASWQGYRYTVLTQFGDAIDMHGDEHSAQHIADSLNARAAGLLMVEGTKAEGLL